MEWALFTFGVFVLLAGVGRLAWPRQEPRDPPKTLGVVVESSEGVDFGRLRLQQDLAELSAEAQSLADRANRTSRELAAQRLVSEPDGDNGDAITAEAR